MTAGQRLKKLRGKKSKREVAQSVGVTEWAYIKYERDERVPRDEVKKRLAEYFKTSVESIFFA